ncbi:flagellar assembly protein FliH [Oceanobacillus damuensis]|uniref:flagellar assembly protein FliH n=1 Tax=Oceanobacillus damuensis TaxID=937928 RepID=UPI00082DA32A|nr:flagellar assembly protein FliH [Oceanobacillus damuensis]
MSDSENMQSNQKLIKIKPVELLRRVPPEETADIMDKDREDIEQKINDLQQEVRDLIRKKKILIEETNQKITEEKQKWDTEKQEWIEKAKQEGYTAGFQQGQNDGRAEYDEKLKQANLIIESTTADYHATIEKSDEAILQLAVQVAGKILNQEISEVPSTFMGVVHGAVNEIKDQSVVTINLHPTNYDLVMQHKEELRRSLGNDTKLTIYIDDNLAENACLIEHPFGQIDASIDTQLIKIREALEDYLMEKRP